MTTGVRRATNGCIDAARSKAASSALRLAGRRTRAGRVAVMATVLSLAVLASAAFAPSALAARAWSAGESLARVVLDPEPVVDGDVIRLGQIARIESDDPDLRRRLEALDVGRAALPGQVRYVQVGTVRMRMRQARLPESQIEIVAEGETVAVRTGFQLLDAEDVKKLVHEWYEATAALPPGASIRLELDVPAEPVPLGALTIDVALSAPKWGSGSIPLELRLDGRLYKRINASVVARVEQPVWVATRALSRGEAVTPEDVELVTRLFLRPADGPAGLDVPLRTTRFVREGTPLTWDLVEPIPDVQKGELVTVVAIKGGVVVQVPGEALSDARVGERVAVRNLGSGSVVYGELADDGSVLVQVW